MEDYYLAGGQSWNREMHAYLYRILKDFFTFLCVYPHGRIFLSQVQRV